MIRDKARPVMADKDPLSDFMASKGWFQLSLSFQKKTVLLDVAPKLVSFCMHIWKFQIAHKFSSDNIFAMDETAYNMNMPSENYY